MGVSKTKPLECREACLSGVETPFSTLGFWGRKSFQKREELRKSHQSRMQGRHDNLGTKPKARASLVAQWLRIHLPMQGTRVQTLVREDPTCHGATKPVRRNYWACALEPASHNYWAHVPQLLKPVRLEPMLHNEKPPQWEARAPQPRVAPAHRN